MPEDRDGPPRIAVVEDDDDFRHLLRLWLGRAYAMSCFQSGETLLAELDALRPDLVLLDYRLPKKDGLQIATEIRARAASRTLPIILVTAMPIERLNLPAFLSQGVSEFMSKPVDYERLAASVRRLTASGRQPPPCFQKPAG